MLANGIIFSSDLSGPQSSQIGNREFEKSEIICETVFACVMEKTHNAGPRSLRASSTRTVKLALTWPGREIDQKGSASSVEQGHCTLVAVKRYRDPPRIGGRHNFLLRPLRSSLNKKRNS